MALGDIHLRFTWQAWHLWHWAGSGGALGRAWSRVTPRNFAWQAWHLVTSTFILRGRRGTWCHPPRLAFSSGPTLRVTSPDVQDRSGNYHHRPSQGIASQLLMKECRLSELEPRTSRNCDPNDAEAHPCRRHQPWPRARGHCLCPLLHRNLRLNSVARRRRDSRPREKKCFCHCNYDTYLSVHIMKWFDAMCEEPFDAVAKVVVCVSEYDETNGLTQCAKNHFWSGKKHFCVRNECGAASVCLSEKNLLLTNCHITGAQLPTRMSCLCICVCVPSFLSV